MKPKRIMEGVYSLGVFAPAPRMLTVSLLEKEFEEHVIKFGFVPYRYESRVSVRNPEWHAHGVDLTITRWHRDYRDAGNDLGLVVWSNETPTEVLTRDGIFQPRENHVVLLYNHVVKHRTPTPCGTNRWFCRWYVKI